jgi:hypothetical protein
MNRNMKLRMAETQIKVAKIIAVELFKELHKMRPNICEWLDNFERSCTESHEIVSLDGSLPSKEMLTLLAAARQSQAECFKRIRKYLEEEGVEG